MKKTIVLLTAMSLLGTFAEPVSPAVAAGSYEMNIAVDVSSSGKAISPYIFGINQYANQSAYKTLNVNAVRQGGNRMTAYNWENNASNAGSDWKYSSDDNLSQSSRPADCAQVLSAEAAKYGIDYKLTTLQLAGYVAADQDGTVSAEETAPSARWNAVQLTKGSAFADTPDLTDGTVYMDEYVNYIIQKLGDSQSATGIQGYSLDNEPALWSGTHSRVHPNKVTMAELRDQSVKMATAVKQLDPHAEIFGPSLYGYTAFDHLADDDTDTEWETLRDANGYHWYLDAYLDQMQQASADAGIRLLDVLDIHYYSESAREGAVDRVQSVRTLYEKGFQENSWIGQWCQANIPILPTVQASIDQYYPGTKLAISEYNFGGEDDVSGAIAQAEALGCFADQGVYFASLWGGSGYIYAGMQLYTNYNGKGGCFGNRLLPTTTKDVSKASAYAATNQSDDSTVTVMVTNKSQTDAEQAVISLKSAQKTYQSAAVYAVCGDSADIKLLDIQTEIQDNEIHVTLPAFSAAMVVVSDDADAFRGEHTYEEVQEQTKSVVFTDLENRINQNGYVEVPITDPDHLSKVILTANVTSSAGSSWGSAGCAVSINAELPDGTVFWTSKGYSLTLGNAVTATIPFDGTFERTVDEETTEVTARIADGKLEFQKWWDASEKQEQEIADVISVTYTKIEVVYETTGTSLRGDVNLDGTVDKQDCVRLLEHLLGKQALTATQAVSADLDGNQALTAVDLTLLKRML